MCYTSHCAQYSCKRLVATPADLPFCGVTHLCCIILHIMKTARQWPSCLSCSNMQPIRDGVTHTHTATPTARATQRMTLMKWLLQYNPGPGEYNWTPASTVQLHHPSTCFLSNVSRLHERRLASATSHLLSIALHNWKSHVFRLPHSHCRGALLHTNLLNINKLRICPLFVACLVGV